MSQEKADEHLIREARDGDMDAFRLLVERHERKIAGVVKGILGDVPEAADVGQEVFIRFFESLKQFRGDSGLATYLIRIAINLSINELKRQKKKGARFTSLDAGLNQRSPNDNNDLKEMLEHEVSLLDPEFRTVVVLRIMEGYSVEETAALLKISQGTVMSRLYRAQKKLKEVIAKKKFL